MREDILDLYGFLERQELEFFEMLINVSGIGPKGALSILGIASIDTLKRAIGTGDTSYLTKISGIGKKTAEKIVIELRDKIADKMKDEKVVFLQGELDALEALNLSGILKIKRGSVKKFYRINTKIREALKILGGK